MNEKWSRLLDAVTERTERGELQWREFGDDMYRVPIGVGYLHVQRGSAVLSNDKHVDYQAVKYSFQLSDELGRVFDDVEAIEAQPVYSKLGLPNPTPWLPINSADVATFDRADRLFRAARKSALNGDRKLDDMLQALGATPSAV